MQIKREVAIQPESNGHPSSGIGKYKKKEKEKESQSLHMRPMNQLKKKSAAFGFSISAERAALFLSQLAIFSPPMITSFLFPFSLFHGANAF
jgi:hypothetical protein